MRTGAIGRWMLGAAGIAFVYACNGKVDQEPIDTDHDTPDEECVSEMAGQSCPESWLYRLWCDNCESSVICAMSSVNGEPSRLVWIEASGYGCDCIDPHGNLAFDGCRQIYY